MLIDIFSRHHRKWKNEEKMNYRIGMLQKARCRIEINEINK